MVSINVEANVKEVMRSLNAVQRKQIPFALAGGLTATAFDAQRAVKKNLRRKYILRNKWTEKGVRVIKANKRTLTSVVFFAKSQERYMSKQQFGGTIRPSGQHLAVPQRIRKTKRKRITPAKRPRRVLDQKNTFKIDIGTQSHLPPGIYQRFRGGKVKMLYAFEADVTIKRSLGFDKTVQGIVNSKFEKNFSIALTRALRTAR